MNIEAKRHKLLGILSEQRKNVELQKEGYNFLGITFENIYREIDCDEDELHSITSDLYTSEEIGYHNANNIVGLFAKDKGVTAFVNKKYHNRIIERRKERVKFILPILAIIISSASLYFSKFTNVTEMQFYKVNNELQTKIDTLEIHLDKLKSYNNPKINIDVDSLSIEKK